MHGLGALPAHFSWYTRALNADGRQWLAYSRAGYGASRRHAPTPYHLGESVDDLVDLIEAAVPEGRQVSWSDTPSAASSPDGRPSGSASGCTPSSTWTAPIPSSSNGPASRARTPGSSRS
ncbi:hypothetical protein ACFQ60_36750 [Streptomyces zhihengii]